MSFIRNLLELCGIIRPQIEIDQSRPTIDDFSAFRYRNVASMIDNMTEDEKSILMEDIELFFRENPEDGKRINKIRDDICHDRWVCDVLNVHYIRINGSDYNKIGIAAYMLYQDYINCH